MAHLPVNLIKKDLPTPSDNSVPAGLGDFITSYLTPPQIATAYNIPPSTGYGVKVGIFSFGGGFQQSDLDQSFADLQTAGLIDSTLSPPMVRQVLLDGQTGVFDPTDAGSPENTLDIYCVATMVPRASITLYIGNSYASMVTQAIADGMNIVTISWGTSEYTRDDLYLQRLADAKITFLCSSDDFGSSQDTLTVSADYPASSPYSMGIGGTKLILNRDNTRQTETDDNKDPNFNSGLWGGGGGISALFSLPSWQNGLFYTPIIKGVTGNPTPLTMRGIPDISAPMNGYLLYVAGVIAAYGGTSAATPTMAGMMARLLQLTGVSRSSVDWNTIAYANPSAFYDITVGTNNDTTSSGYVGTVGWDPVTGLGPPQGTSLYKIVRTGAIFPKKNYGFRPTTGAVYPRKTTGTR